MNPEILDLIHLNTYTDYSANKATDEDINLMMSKWRMEFDEDYLRFLKELNGFKMGQLNIYGTKTQDDLDVQDVLYENEYAFSERPELGEYFIIGYGADEFYAYHSKHKQYCSIKFTSKGVPGGRAFETLDSLLDWAVKHHALRLSDEPEIIQKRTLLYVATQVTSTLEAHGFQTIHGNIIRNGDYQYLRITPTATEELWIGFRTNALRNELSLTFSVFKRYNVIETYFDTEDFKRARIRGNSESTIMLYEDLPAYQSKFPVQEWNDNYETLTARIISFIETHILHAFTLYDNVRALDAKVNASPDSAGNLKSANVNLFQKMIVAKLAGNQRYDDIFRFVKERYEKGNQEFLKLTVSLHDDLQKAWPLKDGLMV